MKSLIEDGLFLSILMILFCIGKDSLPLFSFLICTLIWWMRNRNRSVFAVTLMMLVMYVPRWSMDKPDISQARVISVSSSSAILQSGRTKVIVYTKDMLRPDSIVSFEPQYEQIEESSHFFSSSYASYLHHQGVYYQLKDADLKCIEEPVTLRSFLYDLIIQRNEAEKIILLETVLNIGSKDAPYAVLDQYGFSYGGLLIVINGLLKYILDRKKRKHVMCVIDLLLYLFCGYPLTVLMYLMRDLTSLLPINRHAGVGWSLLCVLLIDPYAYTSYAFIIPCIWRISSLVFERKSLWPYTITLLLNGWNQGTVYPVVNVLYRKIMVISGIFCIVHVICLFTGLPVSIPVYEAYDQTMMLLQKISLSGSIKGAGLIFFIPFVFSLRKHHHFDRIVLGAYVVFSCLGLFHPFMEISFINVGQGDAILIRAPFNTCNVLVDTGKPSAWKALDTFVSAKGIRKLDTLVITHEDDDHSGNMDLIIEKYDPDQIITEHSTSFEAGPFVFYDVNPISDEDENRSSIMLWFSINGMKVMLCGDGDSDSERAVVETYGEIPVDVLKAGHHGSATSSSDLFLDAIRPKVIMITAGSPDLYHHPSADTLQRYLARHIPYLNTFEQGDMTILCIFRWNVLITSSGQVGIVPK